MTRNEDDSNFYTETIAACSGVSVPCPALAIAVGKSNLYPVTHVRLSVMTPDGKEYAYAIENRDEGEEIVRMLQQTLDEAFPK